MADIELAGSIGLKTGMESINLIPNVELVKMKIPVPVADVTERDAIPAGERIIGMKATTGDTTYQLVGGIDNANWEEVTTGIDEAALNAAVDTAMAGAGVVGTQPLTIQKNGLSGETTFGGYTFDGSLDITVPHNTVLSGFDTALTIQFWFKTSNNTVRQSLIQKFDTATDARSYLIDYSVPGKLLVVLSDDGLNTLTLHYTCTIENDTWYNVSFVWETGEIPTLYLNGVSLENTSQTGTALASLYDNTTVDLLFGDCTYKVGRGLTGAMGDIRFWNIARTESQIKNDMWDVLVGNEANLIGYWKGDDHTDGTALDSTTNANIGNVTGAIYETFVVSYVPPPATLGSYAFVGANTTDKVSILDNTVLDGFATSMTLEFWVKFDSKIDRQALIQKFVSDLNQRSYLVDYSAVDNRLMVILSGDGIATATTGYSATLDLDTWYHIAVVWISGEYPTVYLNGSQLTQISQTGTVATIFDSTAPLVFGNSDYAAGRQLDGNIGDIRLWNVARTASQIANNRGIELFGTEEGLVSYWKCDDATGGVATDSTSNSNNGTITGATVETFQVTATAGNLGAEETIYTTTSPVIIDQLTWSCSGDSNIQNDVTLTVTLDGEPFKIMASSSYVDITPVNIRDYYAPEWEVMEFDIVRNKYSFNLKNPLYCPNGVAVTIKNVGSGIVSGWATRIRGRLL